MSMYPNNIDPLRDHVALVTAVTGAGIAPSGHRLADHGPPLPKPHGEEPPPIAARSRWCRCLLRGDGKEPNKNLTSPAITLVRQRHDREIIDSGVGRTGSTRRFQKGESAVITEPAKTFDRMFRGYDPAAVDAYIEVLLTKQRLLVDEVKQLRAWRNESGDETVALRIEVACLKDEVAFLSDTSPSPYAMQHWMAKMMRRAVDETSRMQAEARAEAEALIASAEAEAETARRERRELLEDIAAQRKALETECEESRKKLDAELARMRAEAQSEIDEAWQDAKHERDQLLTDAKEQARQAVDDVSRMQVEARAEAEALIASAEAEAETARRERRELLEDIAAQRKALETEGEESRKKLDAELARMRAEAQSEIDEAWQDAKHERDQLLTDAKEQARQAVDEASQQRIMILKELTGVGRDLEGVPAAYQERKNPPGASVVVPLRPEISTR